MLIRKLLARHTYIPLLIAILLIASRGLFSREMPRTDDLELHGARLANYYLALKQGQIPPKWGPNLFYGFGYPVFQFSYHLPYMIGVIFYIFGFAIEQSINITIITAIFLGGLGAYLLAYRLTAESFYAVVAALLYQLNPYMIANVYIRGAIGEMWALALIPWVVYFLHEVITASKLSRLIVLGAVFSQALLILSHLLTIMIISPLFIVSMFFQKLERTQVFNSLCIGAIALLLTGFYWFPLLVQRSLVQIDTNQGREAYRERFVQIGDLLWSPWNHGGMSPGGEGTYFTITIGIAGLLVIGQYLWHWRSLPRSSVKLRRLILLFYLFFYLLLMLSISEPFWELVTPLQYIQFPWRLMGVVAFIVTLMWIDLARSIEVSNIKVSILGVVVVGLSMYSAFYHARPISFISNTPHDWLEYPKSATSFDELTSVGFDRHLNLKLDLPLDARYRDMSLYLKSGSKNSADVDFNIVKWTGSEMVYEVTSAVPVDVIQRTMYFSGWTAWVNNIQIPITTTDLEFPARIILPINTGKHVVRVLFKNDKVQLTGNILSGIGLLGFVSILYLPSISGCRRSRFGKKFPE